jgi:hypothetical protein
MDNDTARKIDALRKILEEFPEATLCIDSEAAPKVIVGNDPGDETEPDGFHGRSYSAYLADIEDKIEPDVPLEEQFCQCEGVTTYGMMCVDCGKRYNVKTTWSFGNPGVSQSDWCDNE